MAYTRELSDGGTRVWGSTVVSSFQKLSSLPDLTIPNGTPFGHLTSSKPFELPASFTPQGIVIHAVANGRGLDFIMDSGASALTVDPSVATDQQLTVRHEIGGGDGGNSENKNLVRFSSLDIGELHLNGVVFDVLPFTVQQGVGTKVVGLLGYDLLSCGIFGIDFQNHRVTFSRSTTAFPARTFGSTTYTVIFWSTPVRLRCWRTIDRDIGFEGVNGGVHARVTHLHDFVFARTQFESVDLITRALR